MFAFQNDTLSFLQCL